MDFLPPEFDFLKSEPDLPELPDIDALLANIVSGAPIFKNVNKGAFAAKPGRLDAESLLQFNPWATTAPQPQADLARAVAAIVIEKSRARLPTPTNPRSAPEPDDAAWDWQTEVEMIGVPQELPTRPTPISDVEVTRASGLTVTVAEPENRLAKRAVNGELTESDYVALQLGDFRERQLARSAIIRWEKVQKSGTWWRVGYDKKDVVVSEILLEGENDNE